MASILLKEKIHEALASVVPITLIVLALSFSLAPLPLNIMALFIGGAVLLILGMGLFSLGVDIAMSPMGEAIGVSMTRTRKVGLVLAISFFIGLIITVAEPDLQVLAEQVSDIPNLVLVLTVGVGVGVFLVVAMLRILFNVPLRFMLLGFYGLVFLLSAFTPGRFIPLAFDAGGVTTGPITVPFILALGIGVASIRSDKNSHDDSFGLVALCSIGPILSVMLLGVIFRPDSAGVQTYALVSISTTGELALQFLHAFPHYCREVALAVGPIALVFFLYNFLARRFRRRKLASILIGFAYTYVGLVVFLCGVNVGFLPAGNYMGVALGASPYKWLLIPLSMLIGYYIVMAEPAVYVLNKQVEEITNGAVPQSAMNRSLSIGVAISAGLAMTRVLTGISIFYMLIPGYLAAILLSFFVPRIFTGIAFDSGGVASGPMTATFLLPFAMGACQSLGGNILTDAFGVVAMVAMTPLITIQGLGLIYKRRMAAVTAARQFVDTLPDDIIDYQQEAA